MKFIDFFAGIGGMRLGLERAGHKCVGWCEFDKFARKSYAAIHKTDGEWTASDIRTIGHVQFPPRADVWTFGFPCQDISAAGKQRGLAGERSGLFFEIVRLLAGTRPEDRPKWIIAENVKNLLSIGRGFDFARVLCALGEVGYECEWQLLNSKDFGVPQNRERVFIVGHLGGIGKRKVFPITTTDGENPCKLQELTRGVRRCKRVYSTDGLSCTLSAVGGGGGEKTRLYAIDMSYNSSGVTDLAFALQSRYNKGPCGRPRETTGVLIAGNDIKKETDEACTLDASYYKAFGCNQQRTGIMVAPVLTPEREEKRQNGRRMKEPGEPMFTLTAQDRHGVAISGLYTNCRDDFYRGPLEGLSRTLKGSKHDAAVTDGVRIRKLTPRECWRLQGFPDDYFDRAVAAGVSDSQLYKQAGNAVTVNVAEAIGKKLKELE